MNVLVINGSPKGERSNTMQLTNTFLDGLGKSETRIHHVRQKNIQPCLGCFACWNKTVGKCCISDDMAEVIQDMLWAQMIVWSFPLYYFSVPGTLKNLMDRQLPMVLPFMEKDAEHGGHPSRYDMSGKRHVVISTCGFYTAKGNYEGVDAIFDHLCGKGNFTSIYCGQGELFRVKELSRRTGEYLTYVRRAGEELASGEISSETRGKLEQLLYPREVFEAMADASWGVEQNGERTEESLTFTRQMGALYNPASHKGKDIVLEMYYSDLDKRYQLHLTASGCRVLEEAFLPYSTRIETPYTVWKAIAGGEISGQEALMLGKYRVKGDFDLMIHWDRYFGAETEQVPSCQERKETTNMNILLIPWITFWVGAGIDGNFGAMISLAACALVPLLYHRNRKTIYDVISSALVTGCALLLLMEVSARIVLPVSYLCFGVLWLVSCFAKLPLTAHYSLNEYGGEAAQGNRLFLKTNWILTACWGVLYLVTPIWTWFLMGTQVASWTGAINSVLPLFMGLFTAWFQKWYPAKVARG